MKLFYLLFLVLPVLEARLWPTQQRFIRQVGRYGTSGGYRPNLAYSASNNVGSVSSANGIGNNGNSYGNGNVNSNGNVRVAYAPATSGSIVARPYNGIGAFKYGGRPTPGNEFVLNAIGAGGVGGAGGSNGGGFLLNQPKTVYKAVSGSVGRPQASGAYRVGPGGLTNVGRPLTAAGGGGSYHSG